MLGRLFPRKLARISLGGQVSRRLVHFLLHFLQMLPLGVKLSAYELHLVDGLWSVAELAWRTEPFSAW